MVHLLHSFLHGLQHRAQAMYACREPRLHRAQWDVQGLSDFLQTEPLIKAKQDDNAIFFAQLSKGCSYLAALFCGQSTLFGGRLSIIEMKQCFLLISLLPAWTHRN